MQVEHAIVYSGALLNAALAVLVARVRPRRTVNAVLAWLFGLNAAAAALMPNWDYVAGPGGVHWNFAYYLNLASLVPLALLPFVYPERRAPRGLMTALGTAVGVIFVTDLVVHHAFAVHAPAAQPNSLIGWLIFGIGSGALLAFLHAFVTARSTLRLRQVQFVLVAFVLRIAMGPQSTGFDFGAMMATTSARFQAGDVTGGVAGIQASAMILATFALIAATVATLAWSRWRAHRRGAWVRHWRADAFVLAFMGLGFLLYRAGFPFEVEYLVIRPVLLTFGILQFQIVGVDVVRNRGAIVAAIGGALMATFLLTRDALYRLVANATIADASALTATLVLAGSLAFPLARLALPGGASERARRLVVYRAALEGARASADAEGLRVAARVREELTITDAEHARVLREMHETDEDPLAPGALFAGRYRVARRIGRGAHGEVVLARDLEEDRDVAVKHLRGHHARDADAASRIRNEVRLASAVRHRHLVEVRGVEFVDDEAFLVMEHVPGGDLRDRVHGPTPLTESDARAIVAQVCDALDALHASGILHRDVKPANVLLDAEDNVKLSDFTIAREVTSGETVGVGETALPAGTPAYMAPEIARGLPGGRRSDVYAAGAVLYECVTGRPPVDVTGVSAFEACLRVSRERPALPVAGISDALNDALARALAVDPRDRFPSAREMAEALRADAPVVRVGDARDPSGGPPT